MWLGVDTGGTFTDFVLFNSGQLRVHKVLSTPAAPEQAILQGVAELGLSLDGLKLVHGSTVATNAVLERKGVRTVYITNKGLRDVLTIGRQARRELYNLLPERLPPPVPREYCLEVGARLAADGSQVSGLTDADRLSVLDSIKVLQPSAVAINLLFSFLNDADEREIESWLPQGLFVSRSSVVLPEYKEYERGIATWLNAWVGPLVSQYLLKLNDRLAPATIAVMQSSGGTVDAASAGQHAVRLLLSGPAGGLMGAKFTAQQSGAHRLMTFDMGGTSTDVALIDGEIRLTSEGHIGLYPVAVPMVDMHTIGAGGGSIASIDTGGMLRVGPDSAGAAPGPACYGQDGTEATVTDANLVLGRLLPDAFLGGAMQLDARASDRAIGQLASELGKSIEATAAGIIRVANEHMLQALRFISVQRGFDPRDFVLTSFGGAGGLHVCALAQGLGMSHALVPINAGVLSALGMLAAPRARQLSLTRTCLLADADAADIQHQLNLLAVQGQDELQIEGIEAAEIEADFTLDLRYRGQSYTLNVPWSDSMQAATAFHRAHEVTYSHRLELPVELVTLRCSVHGKPPEITLPRLSVQDDALPVRTIRLAVHEKDVPVFEREQLGVNQEITGPALITETVATTFLDAGWRCRVDAVGNLSLMRN